MRERIQKVLAAQGVGSRRQVEAWIQAGRITVNGKPATPGQPVDERDDVRLDGRRLRLAWDKAEDHAGMLYHRPPLEEVRASRGDRQSSLERLPQLRGRRWVAVSPLATGDGGLELFVTDGALAAALMKQSAVLEHEYSVRVRGDFDEARVAGLLQAAEDDPEAKGKLLQLEAVGGEGVNRWARVVCVRLRPRDLKRVFESCGLEANRVLRTRVGPVTMDRALARGRHRQMTPAELVALRAAAGISEAPRRAPSSGRGPARKAARTKRRH